MTGKRWNMLCFTIVARVNALSAVFNVWDGAHVLAVLNVLLIGASVVGINRELRMDREPSS